MSVQQSTLVNPSSRTWLRRLFAGGQIAESCPSWCTDSHVNDHVNTSLDELQHGATLPGVDVQVDDARGGTVPLQLLAPRIAVEPYSDDPTRSVPHVLLEVAPDEYTLPLSPAEFQAVIAQQRAHLDRLERVVLARLANARDQHGIAAE